VARLRRFLVLRTGPLGSGNEVTRVFKVVLWLRGMLYFRKLSANQMRRLRIYDSRSASLFPEATGT